MNRHMFPSLCALLCAGAASLAQSNTVNGIDVKLARIQDITALGRTGAFPDGMNGVAFTTTVCNVGTKQVDWHAAMDPRHPFISFIIVREKDGRFEQISDRSYVKHGFFALSNSLCNSCSGTDGTTLGIGCSDTYDVSNNGDNYWLGPPEELDPWLGVWNPTCSHFDKGEPERPPPQNCDGNRSFTGAQADALGPVGHRIHVKDSDFNVPGASFWFQGMYTIETEGEGVRDDNIGSRAFTASWNGARWILNESGSIVHGSVLSRWSGASVNSAANGNDDGRVYVAVKVTGPVQGLYHYEYAVHNRDNGRGVSALHVPVCSGARVRNLAFRDIDDDAGNDWSISVGANEVLFSGGLNLLPWGTIFNFSFDSDAAPAGGALVLDNPGLAALSVTSSAPLALYNVYLGAGCANDTPPTLYAGGAPARATLGNGTFSIQSSGNVALQPNVLRASFTPGSFVLQGCTLYLGATLADSSSVGTVAADGSGVATHAAPIPNDIGLEGLTLAVQAIGREPGNGPLFGGFELSDGLEVRVGDLQPGCP